MSAHRSKERIEFDHLLKTVSPSNLAALHQQAQPMQRTAQLQAIARGPQHTPIVLTPPPPDRRITTTLYQPQPMGTSRIGASDFLYIRSLITDRGSHQP